MSDCLAAHLYTYKCACMEPRQKLDFSFVFFFVHASDASTKVLTLISLQRDRLPAVKIIRQIMIHGGGNASVQAMNHRCILEDVRHVPILRVF